MSENGAMPEWLARKVWVIEYLGDAKYAGSGETLQQAQRLSGLTYRQFDLATGRMLVSDNFKDVMGYDPLQTIEEVACRLLPADRAAFLKWCHTQFTTVCRTTLAMRVVIPSGEIRWIETQAETFPDAAGRPARVLLTSRDITRYHNLSAELATRSSQLKRVQAAAMVGTWETDLATGVEIYSPEAWALIEPGGSGEANIERFIQAVHPEDRDQVWRRVEEAMETGHYLDEFRVVHPDQTVHWLKGIATVERNEAGQASLMRGVVIDISDRKQAEEATARLAAIIEATPDFVGWSDLDRRTIYANAAARRMCGIPLDEPIVGLPIVEFVAPHERVRLDEITDTILREGVWRGEVDFRARDGRTFPMATMCILHRHADGKPYYISTLARDITAERQAREMLREADRRKDVFLATLAHELRNPLAPLQAASDMMHQLAGADARLEAIGLVVKKQTAHLRRLIDDLLDVSRLTSGKLTLQSAPTAIAAAVEAAVEMCRRDTEAAQHRVEVSLPPEPLVVHGDHMRLTQVLANLIGNSAKYTLPGGSIRVAASRAGDELVISVEDNGIGIAADFLPKVFNAFAQADDQQRKANGGIGLGLMLVKQIVGLHNGSVSAASPGVGQGTRFEVRLPLLAGATQTEQPSAVPAARGAMLRGVGRRVLVVDDYAAIRESLEMMLSLRGFVVETAATGAMAMGKIEKFRPDAVLADLRMPGMSGYELARALRQLPCGRDARLVGMSGNLDHSARMRAIEAGFDHVTVKPVGVDRLIELLTVAPTRRQAVA